MNYLDEVEQELRAILTPEKESSTGAAMLGADCVAGVVKLVRAKLLESYKNGAQAARRQMQRGGQKQNQKSLTPK